MSSDNGLGRLKRPTEITIDDQFRMIHRGRDGHGINGTYGRIPRTTDPLAGPSDDELAQAGWIRPRELPTWSKPPKESIAEMVERQPSVIRRKIRTAQDELRAAVDKPAKAVELSAQLKTLTAQLHEAEGRR